MMKEKVQKDPQSLSATMKNGNHPSRVRKNVPQAVHDYIQWFCEEVEGYFWKGTSSSQEQTRCAVHGFLCAHHGLCDLKLLSPHRLTVHSRTLV